VWGSDCGGADCDNIVWGSFDLLDNIVWGSADPGDNIVWGSSLLDDNIVWSSSDVNDATQFPDDADGPLPDLQSQLGTLIPLVPVSSTTSGNQLPGGGL
jgi:hypothetical protein